MFGEKVFLAGLGTTSCVSLQRFLAHGSFGSAFVRPLISAFRKSRTPGRSDLSSSVDADIMQRIEQDGCFLEGQIRGLGHVRPSPGG